VKFGAKGEWRAGLRTIAVQFQGTSRVNTIDDFVIQRAEVVLYSPSSTSGNVSILMRIAVQ